MDFFDDGGDWQWLDDIGTGVGDFFSGSSNTQPTPSRPAPSSSNWGRGNEGEAEAQAYNNNGVFDSMGNLLSGASNFYNRNQNWIDPVVGFGKEYYKADKASDLADEYKQRMQPSIDFNKEAVARQRAYYDPATAQQAIGAEAARTAGYLTDAWSKQDQPTYANAYARGMLNSDPFARSRATTSTARDKYWTEQAMPAIEDRYYNRGTILSNADTATSKMLTGDPTLQPTYTQADYRSDPFDNALINYFNRG